MSGFWDTIANLNPTKLITSFISEWRCENTIREEAKLQSEIEKLRIYSRVTIFYLQTTAHSSARSLKESLRAGWEDSNDILDNLALQELPGDSCAKCQCSQPISRYVHPKP